MRCLEVLFEAALACRVAEQYLHAEYLERGVDERQHVDVEVDTLPCRRRPLDVLHTSGPAVRRRLLDERSQFHWPVGNLEILKRPADIDGRQSKHRPCALVGVDERPAVIEDDLGGRIDVERKLAQLALAHQFDLAVVSAWRRHRYPISKCRS